MTGLAAVAAGCGGGDDEPSGPIPVDSDPVAPRAYAKPLGAAVELEHAREDDAYRARLITRFTSITPENAMKWANVQPERGEFDFEEADRLVAFARRTGKRVRGHPLVWDSQLPAWVEEGDWSARELRRVMRDHIRAVAGRYRRKIDEWDVVNEPLAKDGRLEENVWHRTLGPRWIAYAFRVAHRVDPDARLFLNEFNAERPGPKSRALLGLVRGLKKLGYRSTASASSFTPRGTVRPAVLASTGCFARRRAAGCRWRSPSWTSGTRGRRGRRAFTATPRARAPTRRIAPESRSGA